LLAPSSQPILGADGAHALPPRFPPNSLTQRILVLALVLGSEAVIASVFLDGASLAQKDGVLTGYLRTWGAWIVRAVVGFAALYTTFAYLKNKAVLSTLSVRVAQTPIRPGFFVAHFFAMATFAGLSMILYGNRFPQVPSDLAAIAWAIAAVAAVVLIGFALAPATLWIELLHNTGKLSLYSAAAALSACALGAMSRRLWEPATHLTFSLVKLILNPIVPHMIVQPNALRIGTSRFTAVIAPECSGLEGLGLLLIFGLLFLIFFREDLRFPQSLLLVPAGMSILFLLNAVRIAILILIGDAGAREIALGGFHSQAGWIAFNSVAFGLAIAARRMAWFSARVPGPEAVEQTGHNSTAAYLTPFLAILAAGILSRTISSNFEWLYALRIFATLGVLWLFRRSYANLISKPGRFAPIVGILAFILWIALSLLTPAQANNQMPAALASAPTAMRIAWIVLRIFGAIVTVPIAEELAFRGFLLRRLISADFEAVSFRTFTWFSLLASSLLFGILHGGFWLPGIAVGILYSMAAVRRGVLADAIIAHATTNALLAAYVLAFRQWSLW
jgi:exosortase E/protease (VPEID-CTERM system)